MHKRVIRDKHRNNEKADIKSGCDKQLRFIRGKNVGMKKGERKAK
ncbi:MAG: hypothetical protein Q8O46_03675 [bacterium]|nr:hypothetical protein [bacterium]